MQLGCCARGVGAVVESGARWGRTRLSGVCEWARAGSHVAIRAGGIEVWAAVLQRMGGVGGVMGGVMGGG